MDSYTNRLELFWVECDQCLSDGGLNPRKPPWNLGQEWMVFNISFLIMVHSWLNPDFGHSIWKWTTPEWVETAMWWNGYWVDSKRLKRTVQLVCKTFLYLTTTTSTEEKNEAVDASPYVDFKLRITEIRMNMLISYVDSIRQSKNLHIQLFLFLRIRSLDLSEWCLATIHSLRVTTTCHRTVEKLYLPRGPTVDKI